MCIFLKLVSVNRQVMKDIFDSANETPLQFYNISQAVYLICVLSTYETPSGEKEVNMSLLWFKTLLHFTEQPTISIHIDFDENLSTRLVVAELETNRNNFKQNNNYVRRNPFWPHFIIDHASLCQGETCIMQRNERVSLFQCTVTASGPRGRLWDRYCYNRRRCKHTTDEIAFLKSYVFLQLTMLIL